MMRQNPETSPLVLTNHLVPRPHILVVSADMHPPGDIRRLLLKRHHQVHGLVIEA